MSFLFFLHSLNQPQRLASPQFTRRSRMQMLTGMLLGTILAPVLEPVKLKIRRDLSERRLNIRRGIYL